jgi:hypothetical protein
MAPKEILTRHQLNYLNDFIRNEIWQVSEQWKQDFKKHNFNTQLTNLQKPNLGIDLSLFILDWMATA